MTILYVLYDLYCVHFFVYLCVVLLWLKQVFCLQIKVKKIIGLQFFALKEKRTSIKLLFHCM